MQSEKNEFKSKDGLTTEYWDIGGGETYFYTEDPRIARKIMTEYPEAATYSRKGIVFAWQFRLPVRLARFWYKRIIDAESNGRDGRNRRDQVIPVDANTGA